MQLASPHVRARSSVTGKTPLLAQIKGKAAMPTPCAPGAVVRAGRAGGGVLVAGGGVGGQFQRTTLGAIAPRI